jgi:hypothetical protein
MNVYLIVIAVVTATMVGVSCFRFLRKLTNPQVSSEDLNAWIDLNWQSSRALDRLLDPNEFAFLRKRGLSQSRVKELRAKRRKLFRMYLRRITHEFNTANAALQMLMVHSTSDRPDLAQLLATQRVQFYRGLVGVEFKLMLNACGFDAVPTLELIRPLERLRDEFCRMAPLTAATEA